MRCHSTFLFNWKRNNNTWKKNLKKKTWKIVLRGRENWMRLVTGEDVPVPIHRSESQPIPTRKFRLVADSIRPALKSKLSIPSRHPGSPSHNLNSTQKHRFNYQLLCCTLLVFNFQRFCAHNQALSPLFSRYFLLFQNFHSNHVVFFIAWEWERSGNCPKRPNSLHQAVFWCPFFKGTGIHMLNPSLHISWLLLGVACTHVYFWILVKTGAGYLFVVVRHLISWNREVVSNCCLIACTTVF